MSNRPSVLVLLHEHDRYPEHRKHLVWSMAEFWSSWGIQVRVARGCNDPAAHEYADLVFPHVDLSVTPAPYREVLERRARVVNAGVYDISKRVISANLVSAQDDYQGPVVVKTNCNFGGLPERTQARRATRGTMRGAVLRALRRITPRRTDLGRARSVDVGDYRVFQAKRDVPAGVFANEALVVERFLPEYRDGLYYCRMYTFLGDHELHEELASPHPIVKGKNIISKNPIAPNKDIAAMRRELGFDFGKFDYVVRDGQTILLDANRTPGVPSDPAKAREKASRLAGGIRSLFGEPVSTTTRGIS